MTEQIYLTTPKWEEWKQCLEALPRICSQIADLQSKDLSIKSGNFHWRCDLDQTRQDIDFVAGKCHAFEVLHSRNLGDKRRYTELPCNNLRRLIITKRLSGKWKEPQI